MDKTPPERIEVWDLPTRIFHWLLALLVITDFFSGGEKGVLFHLHTYAGYTILGLLLFRLAWGFVGGEHARFSDFVRPWREVKDYLESVLSLSPPRYVGHNPAGGWMIVVMLVMLLLIVVTGMMGAVAKDATIPLIADLPRTTAYVMGQIHEVLGNAMMGLVTIHLVGVVIDWLLTRDNIVRAMIDGSKDASEGDRPARTAVVWRAVLLAALSLCLAVYLVVRTRF